MFFADKRLASNRKPGQVIVPIMGKEFHLRLGGFDLGQILDYFPEDSFACEECSDAEEAQKVADHYQRIITAIERQIDAQGGW